MHTSRQSSRQRLKTTISAPLRLSGRRNRSPIIQIEIGIAIEIERRGDSKEASVATTESIDPDGDRVACGGRPTAFYPLRRRGLYARLRSSGVRGVLSRAKDKTRIVGWVEDNDGICYR